MSRLRQVGRRAIVDVAPLKLVPGFRWMYAGMLLAQSGRQLTVVAVPIQVFRMTDSTFAVGLLGLAQLIPLLLVSFVGGALVDAVDRRLLLILAEVVMALTSVGLWWNSAVDEPLLWPLYALTAISGGVGAIHNPARQAMLPGLVGRDLFSAALALNQTQTNVAKMVVPAVGGLLIAYAGLPTTYAIQTLLLVGSVVLLSARRAGRDRGWASCVLDDVDPRGLQLPRLAATDPGGHAHRPRRDGVRDADGAVPSIR